ncbi:MAG TPA: aldo/keto reductase, partial [Roseiarcus sp.]|nr:aldo/keto reductase [Roseiarcus sp.]
AVQSEYSLWTRDPEPEVLPLCQELGIGFVPWGPLGTGYLTGKVARTSGFDVNDFRAGSPRFTPGAMEANQAVVEAVEQLAAAKGATAAQVALAWLLARGPSIVPIFGTRRLDRVKENLGAADVSLSDEDIAGIEVRLARIEVTGERLPPALLKVTHR